MAGFESSIPIAAERETVRHVLSSAANWPEWLPTVHLVEPLDGSELSLGRRFRVVQPKLRPAIWVVTALEAPSRFLWQSQSPGVLVLADHVVEARSSDQCVVSLRVSFIGALGGAIGWFFGSLTALYLAQEAAALQRRVASGGAK
jgi:hypothetical protein